MTKGFVSLSMKTSYQTNPDNLARDFYAPLISQSMLIRRAVGYFRSTVYLLMHEEVVDFFKRKGRFEIICSPELSPQDVQVFERSVENPLQASEVNSLTEELLREAFLRELSTPQGDLSSEMHMSLLAGMLRFGFVEFKIAVLLNSNGGIYHEKRGIAYDEFGEKVAFFGSTNETYSGWGKDGNFESIDVFRSWVSADRERVESHISNFEQVWSGTRPGLLIKSLPQAIQERILESKPTNLDEFYNEIKAFQQLQAALEQKIENNSITSDTKIHSSSEVTRPLDEDQTEALRAWHEAGSRGLLKLATGAGKTLIALNAVKQHVATGSATLILVPSQLLLKQWRSEIEAEMPDATLLLAGGGNVKWKQLGRIEAWLKPNDSGEGRILLSTMQTASSDGFRKRLRPNIVKDLLLVADEVHQLGSPENQNLLKINAGSRLGLSATPERYGDPDGTERIFDYFGGIVGRVITLSDAIKSGRLVPYRYFPHFASLNEEERFEWSKLTNELKLAYARSPRDGNGKTIDNERTKLLKIQRSRIPKKAAQKVSIALSILRKNFEEGQHWLIYCEDKEQLEEVTKACSELKNIKPRVYYSAMAGDPENTLKYFIQVGGVLISIRCLDEGIDIPVISHAIILASSQNPRQFIQRRGRVLRSHKDKISAVIHDVLVIPVDPIIDEQDSLTISEFKRASEFARDALNQTEAAKLREKAMELGLSLSEIYDLDDSEEDLGEEMIF